MKKYLTVLLATIALPAFAANGGWTLMGSPLTKILGNNDTGIICGEIPSYSSGWGENMDVYTNCLYTDANTLPNGYVELWWTVVTNCPTIQHNPIDMIYTTYWSPLTSPGLWTALGSVTNNFIETNWLSTRVASDYSWLTNGYYTTTALETNYVSGTSAIWQYSTNCIGCQTVSTNSGAITFFTNGVCYVAQAYAFPVVACDISNNIVASGAIACQVLWDANTLLTVPATNSTTAMILIKHNSAGLVQWAKTFPAYVGGDTNSAGISNVRGITIDSSNNIIVCGEFDYTMPFGVDIYGTNHTVTATPVPIFGSGPSDAFVAKYTPNGDLIWVNVFGNTGAEYAGGVVVDSSNNVFVLGMIQSANVVFGTNTISTVGSSDLALVKYSPNGNVIWVKDIGGPNIDNAYGITVDRTNNPVIVATWGGGSAGGSVLAGGKLLAKYSGGDGSYMWADLFGANQVNSVAMDTNTGYIIITGSLSSSYDFGHGPTSSGGQFLAEYDGGGSNRWAKTFNDSFTPAAPASGGNAVVFDGSSNIYFTGKTGSCNFGNGWEGGGAFTASFDINGNYRWSKCAYGGGSGTGICLDNLGRVITAGKASSYMFIDQYAVHSISLSQPQYLMINQK